MFQAVVKSAWHRCRAIACVVTFRNWLSWRTKEPEDHENSSIFRRPVSWTDHWCRRKRVRRYYEAADKRLGETGNWLAGFRSFADPHLFVTMGWAKKLGIDLSDLIHLQAFYQRMSADPGVQAALKEEGLI